MQQAVAGERAARIGEHRVVFVEAHRAQRIRPQAHRPDTRARRGIANQNLAAAAAQQFVERVHHAAFAVQEKPQRIKFQLGEVRFRPATQIDAQRGHGVGGFDGGLQTVRRLPFRFGHRDGPHRSFVTGTELARNARHRPRRQDAAARELQPVANLRLLRAHLEFNHGHRRHRAQQMRINDAQQCFGDFGKFVVDLEVHARGQKREGFEQPLDVRVFAFVGFEVQPRGDLGVLLGKLRAHLTQKRQLAFVVEKQVVAHAIRPSPGKHPYSIASPCRKRSFPERGPF